MTTILPCRPDEHDAIFAIVNAGAEAYRGKIPTDCWHEPYMSHEELEREIAAGVVFWGYESDGELIGVMGIQPVQDVNLIRHAYVLTASQGRGIGGRLLEHLEGLTTRRILIGTWTDAVLAGRYSVRLAVTATSSFFVASSTCSATYPSRNAGLPGSLGSFRASAAGT